MLPAGPVAGEVAPKSASVPDGMVLPQPLILSSSAKSRLDDVELPVVPTMAVVFCRIGPLIKVVNTGWPLQQAWIAPSAPMRQMVLSERAKKRRDPSVASCGNALPPVDGRSRDAPSERRTIQISL